MFFTPVLRFQNLFDSIRFKEDPLTFHASGPLLDTPCLRCVHFFLNFDEHNKAVSVEVVCTFETFTLLVIRSRTCFEVTVGSEFPRIVQVTTAASIALSQCYCFRLRPRDKHSRVAQLRGRT